MFDVVGAFDRVGVGIFDRIGVGIFDRVGAFDLALDPLSLFPCLTHPRPALI